MKKTHYKYNIRGWLTDINDINDLEYQTLHPDLFAFKINYTGNLSQDYEGAVTPLFNGNIAETLWRSGSDNVLRRYGYGYDPMNRLTNAIYGKPNSTPAITNNYDEWLTYDANGNILTLGRNGLSDTQSSIILIDQLEYHYKNENSNILIGVNDFSGNTAGFSKEDITNISETSPDYFYDDYGNLVADHNKEIVNILYNHLNLPTKVTFHGTNKFIEYLYTATGQKIQKRVRHQDSTSFTRYIHGFQYYDNVLQFFPTPEGYVKNTPADNGTPSFDYVYQYRDHLGNVRVNYAQDPQTGAVEILDETHYYPFGLQHSNYNSDIVRIKREEDEDNEKILADEIKPIIPVANRGYQYKFGGKELQKEFGVEMYDFGFRNYDPAIGRWMNIDPLADKYVDLSPYTYVDNNPLFYIDPDGKRIIVWYLGKGYNYENGNLYRDGNLYTGNNSFLIETRDALNKLSNASSYYYSKGDKLVRGSTFDNLFVNTSTIHNVFYSKGEMGFDRETGYIYADPSHDPGRVIPTNRGLQKLTYEISLAHEFGHSLSFHYGIRNDNVWFYMTDKDGKRREIPLDEIFAMYIENIFRELLGLPLRRAYTEHHTSRASNGADNLRTLQKPVNELTSYEMMTDYFISTFNSSSGESIDSGAQNK